MNKRFATILAEVFDLQVSDIHSELEKSEVGTWDSLKQMDLVMTLEKEYTVTLDIPDILKMVSVASIAQVLQDKGVSLGD